MNVNKGRMPTKIELTLEQSQQGVSNDVLDWFKKVERPPTLNPEWNKGRSAENKLTRKWLSDLAKAEKPLRTFNDLMSTPINFSAFVMNRLQISELTQDILVGPPYNILKGTSHWGPKRQSFYRYASNRESKHDVYSTKIILAVTNVKVKEWYGYGHLGEIKVQRSDQQLYKFMEGDFPRLHLHDIEDMLILRVQSRLFNLKGDVIVHLAATLRMFTRRIVVKKRVEDL
ncbi:hypothetical protein Tco_0945539 [Tanacetum coccineum]